MLVKYFFISLAILANVQASVSLKWEECSDHSCLDSMVYGGYSNESSVYFKSSQFNRPACTKNNNCWLFLGEVADSVKIKVNGEVLTSYTDSNNRSVYIHPQSIAVPIPSKYFQEFNRIALVVENINQGIVGIGSNNSFISNYEKVQKKLNIDWITRTGGTLFSSYTLFIFSFAFFIMLIIKYDIVLLNLSIYSIITAVYLFSFSEVPREYFNPVTLSGPIHFSLRLIQDFLLARLFMIIFDYNGKFKRVITGTYMAVILFILISYLIGLSKYNFFLKTMLVAAPLVALPMLIGFVLSLRLQDKKERLVLIPLAFLLMILQINDLLVFWRIYSGYFFIKWYPPLIVIVLLTLYIRREIISLSILKVKAKVFEVSAQVAHDLRSPISVLKFISESNVVKDKEEREMLELAVNRVESIANDILDIRRDDVLKIEKKCHVCETIEELVREKVIEGKTNIKFVSNTMNDYLVKISKIELQRVASNLINNAVEASPVDMVIEVKVSGLDRRVCLVEIIDKGKGIPPETLKQFGKTEITVGKQNGNGLGIFSAVNTIENYGGKIKFDSEVGIGTKVSIKLRKV